MGATSMMLSGFCSNTTIPSLHSAKIPFSATVSPPTISSTCSFPQSHKWVIFRVGSCSRTIRACRNSVVEAGGGSSGEDLRSGTRRKKLAVFVSGGGSNFRSIYEASVQGSILGDIVVLVTNKRGCGGAEFAREKGIPIVLFPKTKDEFEGISPADLVASLRGFEVDFVLLAGYLKLLPAELIRAYPKSILNIHPSLLPAFGGKGYYGMKVHKAVVASGARFSGPTIHFVDEHYDTGRILAQTVVPVLPNDTPEEVATRVLQEEHRLYVEVVEAMCEDRIVWRQDGVPLIQSKENPNEYR
ncbi:phosphoribosylglycinamide formyltransferase, chloroplastic [Cannabis sativa]|uniref:phosphoribosylglycinamide formyltransferase, chloroplastic n=1 Tax=Cannabis sativa TaxID=3483 RepID=UPI0029CA7386|nr:phosphoribosylglycinamide formyltransferase, chloroplastic [Cannabis sativa]